MALTSSSVTRGYTWHAPFLFGQLLPAVRLLYGYGLGENLDGLRDAVAILATESTAGVILRGAEEPVQGLQFLLYPDALGLSEDVREGDGWESGPWQLSESV